MGCRSTPPSNASIRKLAVAPCVTAIDRAVVRVTAGTAASLGAAMGAELRDITTRPKAFVSCPGFRIVASVYAATYLAANFADTYHKRRARTGKGTGISTGFAQFSATSAVNLPLSIWQDRAFARLFGTGRPRELPLLTYALFMVRDAGTMGASFYAPAHVAKALARVTQSGDAAAQPPPRWADVTATIACPIGVQLLSSPLHTLALDLYNRPAATHRAGFVLGMWPATFLARAARIVPAYSIGALINRAVRESLPR